MTDARVIDIDDELANLNLGERTGGWLEQALPAYLPSQRWFGDKARSISSIRVMDRFDLDTRSTFSMLAIVEVAFPAGAPALYAIPVAITDSLPQRGEPIATLRHVGSVRYVIDGLNDDRVRGRLLDLARSGDRLTGAHGALEIDRLEDTSKRLERAESTMGRLLGVEQSNSACVFGEDVLIKVFRRLAPGINPDVELTRFLTGKAAFGSVPAYLGSLTYLDGTGESYVLAVAQAFVESTEDGWSHVLSTIRSHLSDPNGEALIASAAPLGRSLGAVTADMHLALAGDPWTPALAPESIKQLDIDLWRSDYLSMLKRITDQLRALADREDGSTRELAAALLEIAPGLHERAEGFQKLNGRSKTRVHGDYHLGQTLHTLGGEFVVLDFEGEPARPIEERRRKTSPLKDVAGMLRSFSYARGTAAEWLAHGSALLPSDLVMWERSVRDAFLDAYLARARAGGASFLPASQADFEAALRAWELDKATYEVLYELNNRPDWLWIPLTAMLKYGEPTQHA